MKENSIEEDINVLKNCWVMTTEHELDKNNMALKAAIKNIVKDYERLLKENQELNTRLQETIKENEELKERIREHTLLISPYYVKENFIPVQKIENLIKELKQDDINMTRKYKEKNNITGELLGIDKVRVRAYREKTREIKEKIQKLLIETKGE
nr:MAG TPA: Speriolin N terminus [Caudoviricetes sp.]